MTPMDWYASLEGEGSFSSVGETSGWDRAIVERDRERGRGRGIPEEISALENLEARCQ